MGNVMKFKSGAPFTDSEFVKNCVLDMPEDVCSETPISLPDPVCAWHVR
jgi:hypothetical protein